ncbi:MAG: hypothetical protein WCD70_04005, partial [Alphaproteobacteria bacterium]
MQCQKKIFVFDLRIDFEFSRHKFSVNFITRIASVEKNSMANFARHLTADESKIVNKMAQKCAQKS